MSDTPEKTFSQQVDEAASAAGITPEITEVKPPAPIEETVAPTHPQPEAAPKPEPAKVEAPPPEPKKEPPQTVPLAVHIRQREKHERELAGLRQTVEQNNARLAELMAKLQPAPAPVDRTTDPLGATLQEMDSLKADIGQTKELLTNWQQEGSRRQQIAAFEQAVVADEQTYTQQVPDYGEAVAFARNQLFREYKALGLDERQAAARVQQDAYALASHALQQGMSPAELAYRVSVEKGYKKTAAKETAGSPDEPVPAAPAANPAQEVVAMRAEGGKRQGSPGGGPTPSGQPSYAELAAMDNDEFANMTAGKKWDKLMRGT